MLHVFQLVVAHCCANFAAARITLPSNLEFSEWDAITHSNEDAQTVQCLRYGILAGYKGLVPTPLSVNHPITHSKDVAIDMKGLCWARLTTLLHATVPD